MQLLKFNFLALLIISSLTLFPTYVISHNKLTPHPSADLGDVLTTHRRVIFTVKKWVVNSA